MAVIELKLDPTRRELKQFGWLLLIFTGALGGGVIWKPHGLIGAAWFMGIAVVVSLFLNSSSPRPRQALGFILPLIFGLIGTVVQSGTPALKVACVVWGMGAVLSAGVWVWPVFARKVYIEWMSAAEPIGWTISHFILGIVFYGVITPIGLIMRLVGRDPMQRKFAPNAATYWEPRAQVADVKRYFRQF